MVFKKVLFFLSAVGVLVFLPSCVHDARPLPKLLSAKPDANVSLTYDVLNKRKSVRYLGRNVVKKGVRPVLITLSNLSDQTYDVALDTLSNPYMQVEHVIKKVELRTKVRILSAVSAGVALSALAFGCIVTGPHSLLYLSIVGDTLIASGVLGAGLGASSAHVNKKFRKIIAQKAFPERVSLLPHSSVSGVVFFDKESFSLPFELTLKDSVTGKAICVSSQEVC